MTGESELDVTRADPAVPGPDEPVPTKLDVGEAADGQPGAPAAGPSETPGGESEAAGGDDAASGPAPGPAGPVTGFPDIQQNGMLLGNRYRLSERIAIGGMGQVWRAADELLGRPVAVKLLSARHAADEQFRTRFQAEARYAASLSHRGIARVYDYGGSGEGPGADGPPGSGVPYLVMELVEGEPLSAALARDGRMPADVTLDIVAQAARALAAAHAAGIVHRDIKPGNLLLTPERQVKITDFGIARAAVGAHLTQTGMVIGTAQYVSPEQASARPVTAASDIYSLGVVAYECLAGRPPFAAETPIALALAHVSKPPPPLPDDVPPAVAALVGQMLAKDPAARPPSANAVAGRASALRADPDGSQDPWLTTPTGLVSPATWFADPSPTTPAQSPGGYPGGPGGPGTTVAPAAGTAAGRPRRRVVQALAAAALVLVVAVGVALAVTMGSPAASPARGHGASHHPVAAHTRRASHTPGYNAVGNLDPGPSPTPDTSSGPVSSPAAPSSPPSPTASSSPSPGGSASGSPSPTTSPTPTPTSPSPSPTPSTSPPLVPQAGPPTGAQTASAMPQDG